MKFSPKKLNIEMAIFSKPILYQIDSVAQKRGGTQLTKGAMSGTEQGGARQSKWVVRGVRETAAQHNSGVINGFECLLLFNSSSEVSKYEKFVFGIERFSIFVTATQDTNVWVQRLLILIS